VAELLRRLIAQMEERFGFRQVTPDDPVGLNAAFVNALSRSAAAAPGPVVLVLDGLDQLDPRGQGTDLAWLPDTVPSNVRIIAAASRIATLALLARRGWGRLDLSPFDVPARRAFIGSYLWQNYHKKLDDDQVETLAAVAPGSNARFLSTALEGMVIVARGIEDLPQLIDTCSGMATVEELYEQVLIRLEVVHERDRLGLVRDALSLLWAARHGLSDREVSELLGPPGDLLPPAQWVPLRQALRPFMTVHSGLTRLPEAGLRPIVERRYLSARGAPARAHGQLSRYYAGRPMSVRVVEELPWHLAALGDAPALARLLADPAFLEAAWPVHRYELVSYWSAVEEHTAIRMTDVLKGLAGAPPGTVMAAAQLLAVTGHRLEALELAGELAGTGGAPVSVLDLAASLALEVGDLATARVVSERQATQAASSGDHDAQVAALGRLAAVHRRLAGSERVVAARTPHAAERRAALDQVVELERTAKQYLGEAEFLAGAAGARDRAADLLGQRARLLEQRGETDAARAAVERRVTLYRQLGDLTGLQDALAHQGRLEAAARRSSQALTLFGEAEALARRLRDPAALQACLGDQAEILIAQRRLDDALRVLEERERLARNVLHDPCAEALTLLQRAVLFGEVMKRSVLGLDLVEQCENLARAHGCEDVLVRAATVRGAIVAAQLRGRI
jgi:tetratricopeptide (TPR) repeat protein